MPSTFPGEIRTTAAESTPWWPPAVDRETKRPNVVLVILDDTGWSDLGCFGSEIATPNFDRLAHEGLRYRSFHVTPLCSPTRAAVLTGRNHHSIGMRFLADTDTGFPNSRGAIRPDVALLPQILSGHGYANYLVGKWHLAPLHEITPSGPFHNWPLARGFDRYYGFLDGCTDQYEPELYEDNHPIPAPDGEDYHLTEDLADRAIAFLRDHVTFRPDDSFFLQLALGATHAPFQAPREYIEKYLEVFTKGWDQTRVDRLRRQIEAGIVPEGTELAPRNGGVPAWEELDAEQQKVYVHLQAAFAAFLEHADEHVGRVLDALQELGEAENTIVVVMSDNGASREGGPSGDVDTNAPYSGVRRSAAEQLPYLEELGTLTGGAHYPEGWAMAGNTPFRRYKQFVDLGGVRSPLIVSWPGAPARAQGIRDQFVHAIDIAPTLLDLIGIEALPEMDGRSLATTLTDAQAPAGRRTQYWETLGHRAVWDNGWKAVTAHTPGVPYEEDQWRLYDTHADFSESRDLAEAEPERLQQLQQLWWREAGRNDVFPLDDRPLQKLLMERPPTGLFAEHRIVLRPGQSHIPFPSAITGSNRDIDVHAHLSPLAESASGILLSSGNAQGGYLFYLDGGTVWFEHAHLEDRVAVNAELAGARTASFRLRTAADGSARVELFGDEAALASAAIPRFSAHLSFWGMDVGHAPVSTFSTRIAPPFALPSGILDHIEMRVFPQPDDLEEYAEAVMSRE
ncbi:MAG TPA: arylsulfatase [Beutenbergiaceae bacterium]|nr:arylsulfatase [Beutenbergiaceae bacterium]